MTTNLQHFTDRYASAVTIAELRWATLKGCRDRFNPRLLARYVRSLRRCHHLRESLRLMMEQGTL